MLPLFFLRLAERSSRQEKSGSFAGHPFSARVFFTLSQSDLWSAKDGSGTNKKRLLMMASPAPNRVSSSREASRQTLSALFPSGIRMLQSSSKTVSQARRVPFWISSGESKPSRPVPDSGGGVMRILHCPHRPLPPHGKSKRIPSRSSNSRRELPSSVWISRLPGSIRTAIISQPPWTGRQTPSLRSVKNF